MRWLAMFETWSCRTPINNFSDAGANSILGVARYEGLFVATSLPFATKSVNFSR